MKKIIFILLLLLMKNMHVMAQTARTWRGINSTWASSTNWVPNGIPGTGDDLTIEPIGATVGGGTVSQNPNISGTSNCRDITFNIGSQLTFTGGSLNVYGSFTNNSLTAGVLVDAGATPFIRFRFTSAANVGGGNTDFGIVEINKSNPGSVTLNSTYNYTISDHLILTARTLNTNGKLTFLSNASTWKTAYIQQNGTSNINGNVIMQQRVDDADDFKTYHLVCSPVYTEGTGGDPDHWSTTMLEDNTVASPDYHNTGSWSYSYPSPGTIPDWQFYDETISGSGPNEGIKSMYGFMNENPSWTGGSSTKTDVEIMQGCWGRFEATSNLLDWTGIPNSGSLTSQNLTYTNNSQDYDGANFIGNPYPSPIDLSTVYANNSSNISKYISVWKNDLGEYTGTYQTFDASIPSGVDFDGIAAIGQGFWVIALQNNVTVSMDDGDRSYVDPLIVEFRRTQLIPLSFHLKLESTLGNNDITFVRFGNFDNAYLRIEDGPKLFGPEDKGNALYTKVDQHVVAQNNLAQTKTKTIIPIVVKLEKPCQINLRSKDFNIAETNYNLVFEDRKYGRFVTFDADFEYTTFCNEGVTEGRFFIHTIAAGYEDNIISKKSTINSFYADGKIMVQNQTKVNEQALVQITDVSGRIIYNDKLTISGLNVINASQFSKGIYNITLTYNNGNVESQKLSINN
jgi:hypothetical protein